MVTKIYKNNKVYKAKKMHNFPKMYKFTEMNKSFKTDTPLLFTYLFNLLQFRVFVTLKDYFETHLYLKFTLTIPLSTTYYT